MPKQPTAQQRANLAPFTGTDGHARAVAAGIKSGEVRRAKKQANELQQTTDSRELHKNLTELVTTFERGNLPLAAAAAAQYLIARVLTGGITIEGRDVASLISALVDVARLEGGQSTSHTVIAHMSSVETMERLQELRGPDAGGAKRSGTATNPERVATIETNARG